MLSSDIYLYVHSPLPNRSGNEHQYTFVEFSCNGIRGSERNVTPFIDVSPGIDVTFDTSDAENRSETIMDDVQIVPPEPQVLEKFAMEQELRIPKSRYIEVLENIQIIPPKDQHAVQR